MKYIIHIGICGFGNQLLGFKELCILSKYTDRKIILPIFIPHGTIRNSTKKFYEFKEIFDVEHFKQFYDCEVFENIKNIKINKVYNIRSSNEDNITIPYFHNHRDYYNIKEDIEKVYLKKKFINSIEDINELKTIEDDVLVLLGTFNTLKLSICNKNGCLNKNCKMAETFKKEYYYTVSSLIHNKYIKDSCNKFLKEKNLNDYTAFHLRTPDLIGNKIFKECYNNLNEENVYQSILNYLFETNNYRLVNKIFIAIPPDGLKIKDMTIFNSNKIILLNEIITDKFILSLIESEICNNATILINSPTNTPYEIKEHTRSSFTMHIRDLREINNLNKLDKCITEITNNNFIEIIKQKFISNKKVISFALYNNKDIYNYGILLNYELKKLIYKDWIIQLYIDETINNKLLDYLKTLDIEIFKIKSNIPPMFYRFFPLCNNSVEYFISRDLDSLINFREKKMVEEWIDSGKNLHLIHEVYPGHRHIIMGGMFGFKKNIIPKQFKYNLNEKDEFYYEPWKETCLVKWTHNNIEFVGKNNASKNWTLSIENTTKFFNGDFVEILWHGKEPRTCKIIDNNTILVIHNNINYYFRKSKSNTISIYDKNIYNEIINFYINIKRDKFLYGDDQNFIANFLSEYIPTCIDHNQMQNLRWDYSIKFNKIYTKLNTIYKNMNNCDCYIGHRVDTKKIYKEYFGNIDL
tara:strand:+ start:807 stop:2885 length:2079 start_codon:yes stop_codon:yes gene_type:complete